MSATSRRRRAFLAAATAVVAVAAMEGVALLAFWLVVPRVFDEPVRTSRVILAEQTARMRTLLAHRDTSLLELDTLLGWRYRSGYTGGLNQVNAQGVRATRTYTPRAAEGVLRVALFGDSFVYGNGVATDESLPAQLESAHTGVEALNYGVGGYGVDQAFLRYRRDGLALMPHVVAMGFTEDDLSRVVNRYRRFRASREHPLGKPRFVLGGGDSLEFLATPLGRAADYEPYLDAPASVRAIGAHDQWYSKLVYQNPLYDRSVAVRLASATWLRVAHRYVRTDRLYRRGLMNPDAPAFRIQVRLFRDFARSVEASGARPVVLFLPSRESILRARAGLPATYQPLREASCGAGVVCLDAIEAFRAAPDTSVRFTADLHYAPSANRLVATWLGKELARLAPAGRVPRARTM